MRIHSLAERCALLYTFVNFTPHSIRFPETRPNIHSSSFTNDIHQLCLRDRRCIRLPLQPRLRRLLIRIPKANQVVLAPRARKERDPKGQARRRRDRVRARAAGDDGRARGVEAQGDGDDGVAGDRGDRRRPSAGRQDERVEVVLLERVVDPARAPERVVLRDSGVVGCVGGRVLARDEARTDRLSTVVETGGK